MVRVRHCLLKPPQPPLGVLLHARVPSQAGQVSRESSSATIRNLILTGPAAELCIINTLTRQETSKYGPTCSFQSERDCASAGEKKTKHIVLTLLVWLTRHSRRLPHLFFCGNCGVGAGKWGACRGHLALLQSTEWVCRQQVRPRRGVALKPCQRAKHISRSSYFWFDIEMPFSNTRRCAHPNRNRSVSVFPTVLFW